MNVLLCTTGFANAATGSGTAARMIASLADTSLKIDVLSDDHLASHPFELTTPLIIRPVPLLVYAWRGRSLAQALKPVLQSNNYDIILFNDVWIAGMARHILHRYKGTARVIAFIHDDNTLDLSVNWPDIGRSFHYWSRRLIERRVVRHLDALLTNSRYMSQRIAQVFSGVPVHHLYYCSMRYTQVEFRPKPIDPASPISVLFVKHDFMRGGLRELILALHMLTTYRFRLNIVSQPHVQLKRKLGHLVNSSARVEIEVSPTVTGSEDMVALYHSHDIVCVPSRREALGLVNAEALAAGTPIVSTPVGGIPEVLDNGHAGTLAKDTRAESIAEAIATCIENPAITMQKVMHGRAFVTGQFSVEHMRQEVDRIFNDIAG